MFVLSRQGGLLGKLVRDRLFRVGQSVGILGVSRQEASELDPEGRLMGISLDDERDIERQLSFSRALVLLPPGPGERALDESKLLHEARQAGVRRVVRVSMYGADPLADEATLRSNGRNDEAVMDSGISYAILRPHLLMQDLLLYAPSIRAGYALRAPVPEPHIGLVDLRDVADAVAAVLQRAHQQGEIHDLTGPRLWTLKEVARAIGDANAIDIACEEYAQDDYEAALEGIGLSPVRASSVAAILAQYTDAQVTREIARLTGLPPRAFEMFLLDNRSQFTNKEPMRVLGGSEKVDVQHALTW